VPLGTSNLTITTSLATGIVGAATAYLFTDDQQIIEPVAGASAILGAGAGYYIGTRTRIQPGDAALINSSIVWGTTAGVLFALSFDATRVPAAGLVLSGVGMGGVGGVLLTRSFDISRTHAALIDVGGLIGVIGGLALEGLIYGSEVEAAREQEHLANFALGGMAVGLISAGILTRNWDARTIPVKPSLGTATDAKGATTTTFGVGGAW
jgi:hypothetical protein